MSQQLRLVIADDESIIRMNLKETLVDLGYLVVGEAGDGVSVINLARELRPDLVIMDIRMPKLDGIQAAKSADRREDRAGAVVDRILGS
jgi:YesN/AraC family two-component response regulator